MFAHLSSLYVLLLARSLVLAQPVLNKQHGLGDIVLVRPNDVYPPQNVSTLCNVLVILD